MAVLAKARKTRVEPTRLLRWCALVQRASVPAPAKGLDRVRTIF